MRKKLL